MFGVIIGDIVGSTFEHHNCKRKDIEIFAPRSKATDDTVMSLAVAAALLEASEDFSDLPQKTITWLQKLGNRYPWAGYGGRFRKWLGESNPQPYKSWGNGSAMRVGPCAWVASSLDEVKRLSRMVTEVTHNSREGVKGAEAVAVAIYMARTGSSMEEIRNVITREYYELDFTLDSIREDYTFDVSCQGSVPQALQAFFESNDFEDAIRNAISIGGDSDTIAAITGSVAEAYYGVPETLAQRAMLYLDDTQRDILTRFMDRFEGGLPFAAENGLSQRYTPELITSLQPNEIFVFGSNLEGRHAGGAARFARKRFGAVWGQGVGLQGQCYAIPTMHGGVDAIAPYVDEFIRFASAHPELHFLVTPIGCGIAGFRESEIAPLFRAALQVENITLPKGFHEVLNAPSESRSGKLLTLLDIVDSAGSKFTTVPEWEIRLALREIFNEVTNVRVFDAADIQLVSDLLIILKSTDKVRECLQTHPEVVDSHLRQVMQKLQEEENDIMRQFLLTAHLKGNQPIPATLLTHQLSHPVGIIREFSGYTYREIEMLLTDPGNGYMLKYGNGGFAYLVPTRRITGSIIALFGPLGLSTNLPIIYPNHEAVVECENPQVHSAFLALLIKGIHSC